MVVKKPGMVRDPIINNPINTEIPTKTLFEPFMYLLITPIKITNTKKIKNETRVLPEKKSSATKDTKIKIRITPRKAIVLPPASRAPRCASASIPLASPLTIQKPLLARSTATSRQILRP